ncbi:MAG: hypothetical protein WCD86_06740 [Ktedonobacteraceae bacterium]
MAKVWDDIMKRMFAANPQHFLNWLAPGAVLVRELSPLLKTRDIEADGLYAIIWYDKEIILHVEFQRRGDDEMGKRLWEYNSTTGINSDMVVMSVVIYLRDEREIVDSPYIQRLPNGEPVHAFFYQAIKLWELPAELFFRPGLEGLLPLVTLMRDGDRYEIAEAMIERLAASRRFDLLAFAYAFAGLTFNKRHDYAWLTERFAMYKKEMEDSWTYQGILQEGREEGREALRETLISLIAMRYPTLSDLVKEQTRLIKDISVLRQAVIKVSALQTAGEIEEYLLSLCDDATKN